MHSRLDDTACNTLTWQTCEMFFIPKKKKNHGKSQGQKLWHPYTAKSCRHGLQPPYLINLWGHSVWKPLQKTSWQTLGDTPRSILTKCMGDKGGWRSPREGWLSTRRGWSCMAHAHNSVPSLHHTSACSERCHGAHGEREGWGSRWGRSRAGCG